MRLRRFLMTEPMGGPHGRGCDGLLALVPGDDGAAFGMRMFNSDGSEAETCLNGLRCTARLGFEALGLEACFFVLIRTAEHDPTWAAKFIAAVRARPEVVEAHRLAGDIDYLLKVQVRNARAYDRFYQSLISEIRIQNVTALLSMEEMKATSALPIPPA